MADIKKYLNKIKEWVLFAFLILVALVFVANINYRSCVLEGINLWFFSVVPALFPYIFITNILSSLSVTSSLSKALSPATKRLFNTNGLCGYAFFISILSGYPVGAKTVCDLKNNNLISSIEATRASVFCSTSSPVFLISLVGGVLAKSTVFGILLFITHLASSIIAGIIFSFYKKNEPIKRLSHISKAPRENILFESASNSVISILTVGALITVFYLLTEILLNLKILSPIIWFFEKIFSSQHLAKGLTIGILESTNGLKILFSKEVSLLSLPLASFICGFGGVSVIAQSVAYLKKAKIKTAPFLLGKVITAFINFILGFIISLIVFSQ